MFGNRHRQSYKKSAEKNIKKFVQKLKISFKEIEQDTLLVLGQYSCHDNSTSRHCICGWCILYLNHLEAAI